MHLQRLAAQLAQALVLAACRKRLRECTGNVREYIASREKLGENMTWIVLPRSVIHAAAQNINDVQSLVLHFCVGMMCIFFFVHEKFELIFYSWTACTRLDIRFFAAEKSLTMCAKVALHKKTHILCAYAFIQRFWIRR